jgi:hypothetical protein
VQPDHSAVLAALQALEVELHHPGVCCTPDQLEQLLHADFHEVGRSGLPYDRATVLAYLQQVTEPPPVVSDDFRLALLAPGVALLTYRAAERQADGALGRYTHRSSLWVQTAMGWQLRHHQGTPAAQPW